MPMAHAPRGGLYKATIVSEPCEGGFRARVSKIELLSRRSAVGTDVAHNPFPFHFALSPWKAERLAEAYFKLWAEHKMLGL